MENNNNNTKSIIDGLILDGKGMEAFEELNVLSSEDLASIRNKCKSIIKKAKSDKSLSIEDVDSITLIQNKKMDLIKAMVNTRFSDNGMSTSRISSIILEAINNI